MNLFKLYFTEKGKNIATQEDIADITERIESVKNEVQYEHSQRAGWLEQNKIALTNFFDEYIHWTGYSLKNFDAIISNTRSPEIIRKLIHDLNFQKIKIEKCY